MYTLVEVRPATMYVYMLRCADGLLHVDVACDVAARVYAHNCVRRGAVRRVWANRPAVLVWVSPGLGCRQAYSLERRMKKMTTDDKERIALWHHSVVIRNNMARIEGVEV